jgi:beta-lactamase family protein
MLVAAESGGLRERSVAASISSHTRDPEGRPVMDPSDGVRLGKDEIVSHVRFVVVVLALATMVIVSPASARLSESAPERRLGSLKEIGIPGAQVNVDGRTAAAGVADVVTEQPMRPTMAFRAGSITKSFTATVVLQLVAERRLRLGETVERWLPGVLPYGEAVTVRALLQHTSGVPDYWEAGPDPLNISFVNDAAARAQTYAPLQLVNRVSSQPPDFAAGAVPRVRVVPEARPGCGRGRGRCVGARRQPGSRGAGRCAGRRAALRRAARAAGP